MNESLQVRGRDRRPVLWGVILIALGLIFLAERFGALDLPTIGRWWPAALIVIGAARLGTRDQFPSGVTWILLGLWFFACNEGWYGLTYRTGWPLVLIVFGIESILKAVLWRNGSCREVRHG